MDKNNVAFCNNLNKLIAFGEKIANTSARKATVSEIKNKIETISISDSVQTMRLIGPELFEKRNEIISRNEDYFLQLEIKDKEIEHFVEVLQAMYKETTKENRDFIYLRVLEMLKHYTNSLKY